MSIKNFSEPQDNKRNPIATPSKERSFKWFSVFRGRVIIACIVAVACFITLLLFFIVMRHTPSKNTGYVSQSGIQQLTTDGRTIINKQRHAVARFVSDPNSSIVQAWYSEVTNTPNDKAACTLELDELPTDRPEIANMVLRIRVDKTSSGKEISGIFFNDKRWKLPVLSTGYARLDNGLFSHRFPAFRMEDDSAPVSLEFVGKPVVFYELINALTSDQDFTLTLEQAHHRDIVRHIPIQGIGEVVDNFRECYRNHQSDL